MSRRYTRLLSTPGAPGFFLTAFAGRIGIAMTPLGLVWLVHARTDSFALSGLVTGALAVSEALIGPQVARVVDRFGQTNVLPWQVGVHLAAASAMTLATSHELSASVLMVTAVLVGASIPQLGALSSARWIAVLGRNRQNELTSAFSLESIANSGAFLIGPALVSVLGALGQTAIGTLAAACLITVAGIGLSLQRRTSPGFSIKSPADRPRRGRSTKRYLCLVLANGAIGLFFGAMQVGVTSFAVGQGSPQSAAGIFLTGSLAGIAGGIVFGAIALPGSPSKQFIGVTTWLSVACIPFLFLHNTTQLAIAVVFAEVIIPPTLALSSVLIEKSVHNQAITQAYTWANSANAGGAALAAAITGRLADVAGGGISFLPALVGSIAALALAVTHLKLRGNQRANDE